MTSLAPPAPSINSAQDILSAYTDDAHTAALGYIVVYSIFVGQITLPEATAHFERLHLNVDMLPGPLREDDAFLRVTGSDGVHDLYDLNDLETDSDTEDSAARPKRTVNLMIRPVRRDGTHIIRHLVRELRDETAATLTYDTHLGEVIFEHAAGKHGPGQLVVRLDYAALAELSDAEQTRVHAMVDKIRERYVWQCRYLGADRIRTMLLDYMRSLEAVPVRPSGGVYFVTVEHAAVLQRLHDFVTGCVGGQSLFARIPLPDEAEMRQLIIRAFTDSAKEAAQRLSVEIAAAAKAGAKDKKIVALSEKFRALRAQIARYSQRLQISLDDTDGALGLAEGQLTALLHAR